MVVRDKAFSFTSCQGHPGRLRLGLIVFLSLFLPPCSVYGVPVLFMTTTDN